MLVLVLAGVITGVSLAVGGAVLAAIAIIVGATVLVTTGRADAISSKARLPLVGIGGAGASQACGVSATKNARDLRRSSRYRLPS